MKDKQVHRGYSLLISFAFIQGYILCKILWWGEGNSRWEKFINEDSGKKEKKGEGKRKKTA